MKKIKLREIAVARSGDKGAHANIGVIANDDRGYQILKVYLTSEKVGEYFKGLKPSRVERYVLPNLKAVNFVLYHVLDGGGSVSLRIDAQGKALGQALLEMFLEIEE